MTLFNTQSSQAKRQPLFGIWQGEPFAALPSAAKSSPDSHVRSMLDLPAHARQADVDRLLADPVAAANDQFGLPSAVGTNSPDVFLEQQAQAAVPHQVGLGVNATDEFVAQTIGHQLIPHQSGGLTRFDQVSEVLAQRIGVPTKARLAQLAQALHLEPGASLQDIMAALGRYALGRQ